MEDAKTGIESAFPTASRTLIDVCKPLEAKKSGMRAGKEVSARAKSPVSWQLAREILLSKFLFCFFCFFRSRTQRTTARHASTQSAKDATTRDISWEERRRARGEEGLREERKQFSSLCESILDLCFPSPRASPPPVSRPNNQREEKKGSPFFSVPAVASFLQDQSSEIRGGKGRQMNEKVEESKPAPKARDDFDNRKGGGK